MPRRSPNSGTGICSRQNWCFPPRILKSLTLLLFFFNTYTSMASHLVCETCLHSSCWATHEDDFNRPICVFCLDGVPCPRSGVGRQRNTAAVPIYLLPASDGYIDSIVTSARLRQGSDKARTWLVTLFFVPRGTFEYVYSGKRTLRAWQMSTKDVICSMP